MVGEQRQVVFSVVEAGLAVWNGVCQGGRVGGPVTDGPSGLEVREPHPRAVAIILSVRSSLTNRPTSRRELGVP